MLLLQVPVLREFGIVYRKWEVSGIETIKMGDPAKAKKLFKCENCGCVFKASKEEYNTSTLFGEGMNVSSFDCECPYCGLTAYPDKAER